MTNGPYDSLPCLRGVREAARFLDMDHTQLSRKARKDGSGFAPDHAGIVNGIRIPMWSESRLREIQGEQHRESGSGNPSGDR